MTSTFEHALEAFRRAGPSDEDKVRSILNHLGLRAQDMALPAGHFVTVPADLVGLDGSHDIDKAREYHALHGGFLLQQGSFFLVVPDEASAITLRGQEFVDICEDSQDWEEPSLIKRGLMPVQSL